MSRPIDRELRELPDYLRESTKMMERKTGRWIINGHYMTCNKCGICMCNTDREGDPIPKGFCPNCGVKMVGKR